MARIGQQARITVKGIEREGVDGYSPVEDQAALVYKAARRYAEAHGFKEATHRGTKGLRGPLVMRQITQSLFPELDTDTFNTINSIIYQALRRTDAAVCVYNPHDRDSGGERQTPEWFIADSMPSNLTVVTVGLKKKGANGEARGEERILRESEKRLTPQEAGEDLPPGEVTVSHTATQDKRAQTLNDIHERRRKLRAELKQRVLEEIMTQKMPVSVTELETLIRRDGVDINRSTIRKLAQELDEEGKTVSRKETLEEALVRGGGSIPRATRPTLWWPAPGPVPVRTELPPGIEPTISAAEQARRRQAAVADLEKKVLEVLGGRGKIRTVGQIANHLGLPPKDIKKTLDKLLDSDKVYTDYGRYFLSDRRRKPREDEVQPEVTSLQPKAPRLSGNPHLDRLLDYAKQLVVHQRSLDSGAADRIRELEALIAQKDETINHLRAALSNLQA